MELTATLQLPAAADEAEAVVRRVERFLLDAGTTPPRLIETLSLVRERLARAQATGERDATVRVTIVRGEPLVTIVFPVASRLYAL